MTLRLWAIKIGELKPLTREGLLLFGVRCAMRVEHWLPPDSKALWSRGLEYVLAAAFSEADRSAAAPLRRELSDRGALASNQLATTDAPLGRCMNYATQTLAHVIDVTCIDETPAMKKAIIETAKLSGSIAGVLAHAGRVDVEAGADPVDVACTAIWDAIHADVSVVAAASARLKGASTRVQALRDCAPLWLGEVPQWATTRFR